MPMKEDRRRRNLHPIGARSWRLLRDKCTGREQLRSSDEANGHFDEIETLCAHNKYAVSGNCYS